MLQTMFLLFQVSLVLLELIIEVPRTSRSQMFFKIGVLKYFAIFTEKNTGVGVSF